MRSLRPFAAALFLGVLLSAAPGCAKKEGDTGDSVENNLRGIHELYETYLRQAGKPPAKLQDLTRMGAAFPTIMAALRQGECVYVWGAGGRNDPGETIIAYEQGAAERGGLALQKDGTIREVKAGEIRPSGK
jgi:hypothetical protein